MGFALTSHLPAIFILTKLSVSFIFRRESGIIELIKVREPKGSLFFGAARHASEVTVRSTSHQMNEGSDGSKA